MSKRTADQSELEEQALKSGQRPIEDQNGDGPDFEDEYEDEFESEDEILEAGVDGRPDEEREAEEREGRFIQTWSEYTRLIHLSHGGRPGDFYPRKDEIASRRIIGTRLFHVRDVAHSGSSMALPVF